MEHGAWIQMDGNGLQLLNKSMELGAASVLALIWFPLIWFFVHRLPGPLPSVSYWSHPTVAIQPPHLSRVIAGDREREGGLSGWKSKHPCLLFLISIKPSLWAIQNGSKSRNNVRQPNLKPSTSPSSQFANEHHVIQSQNVNILYFVFFPQLFVLISCSQWLAPAARILPSEDPDLPIPIPSSHFLSVGTIMLIIDYDSHCVDHCHDGH